MEGIHLKSDGIRAWVKFDSSLWYEAAVHNFVGGAVGNRWFCRNLFHMERLFYAQAIFPQSGLC